MSKFNILVIILINFVVSSYSWAVEKATSNTDEEFLLGGKMVRVPKSDIEKFLKDLPPWSAETKRWYMYADDWFFNDGNYTLKGKYLVIDQSNEVSKSRLKFYEQPDNKSKYNFELSSGILYKNGMPVCESWKEPPLKVKVSKYTECTFAFCETVNKEKEIGQLFYPDEMVSFDGTSVCPYKMRVNSTSDNAPSFNFPELSPASNGFYKVQIDSSFYYLALDQLEECRKKLNCYQRELPMSFLERKWVKFKLYEKNKNLDSLNKLRQSLLPCLEMKDIACIKNHFITKEEFKNKDNRFLSRRVGFKETVIDEKVINELKACMNYKLLHVEDNFIATRGINKACLIYELFEVSKPNPANNVKILSVAYPEALRRDAPYNYRYVPEN